MNQISQSTRPLFSTAALLVIAFFFCIASVAVTWLLRGRQLSATLPLSVAALTLMLVIPAGQFIRNRCRLSLRSMLVLLTAIAVLLGLFGTNLNRARVQRRAVRSVQALNLTSEDFFSQPQPSVGYDRSDDFGGDFVRTSGGWIVPLWLVDFLGEDFFFEVQFVDIANMDLSREGALANAELWHFDRIHFRNCKFGPSAIEAVGSLRGLRYLEFVNAGLTDIHLNEIAKLDKLETLSIQNDLAYGFANHVTPEGLSAISSMTGLRNLSLANIGVSNDELSQLRNLNQLRWLDLSNNPLSNASAKLFSELPSLVELDVRGSKINEHAIPLLQPSPSLKWVTLTASSRDAIRELEKQTHGQLSLTFESPE